jgi:recA bacterial DNA recombination protein
VSSRALDLVLDPELAAQLVPLERLAETRGRRPTGIAALDELLGGGWPRAALSEISGRRSSGRTAIVRAALAAAIAAGEATALIDAGGTLDARAAAAGGLSLPALLWIRCATAQALKATDLVVAAGGFGMAVLDLCDAQLRAPDAAWVRLRHAARAQGTTVLVATGTRRLGSFAAAAIELDGGRPAFFGPPSLFAGLDARATRTRGTRDHDRDRDRDRGIDRLNQPPCVSLVFTSRS